MTFPPYIKKNFSEIKKIRNYRNHHIFKTINRHFYQKFNYQKSFID